MDESPKRGRGRPRVLPEAKGFALRLPVELHEWLRRHAFDEERSINEVIVEAVEGYRALTERSSKQKPRDKK